MDECKPPRLHLRRGALPHVVEEVGPLLRDERCLPAMLSEIRAFQRQISSGFAGMWADMGNLQHKFDGGHSGNVEK